MQFIRKPWKSNVLLARSSSVESRRASAARFLREERTTTLLIKSTCVYAHFRISAAARAPS